MAIFPGMEELSAMMYVNQFRREGRYDVIILDCAPTAESLRFVSMPTTLDWYMKHVFPAQRGLLKVVRPIANRLSPVDLPADSYFANIRELYDKIEGIDTLLEDPLHTSVRLETNAEKMVEGRRTNMITWKNFATDSGKATTRWKYDGYRGFMTNKVYDDGLGPFYSYTLGGRMRTRTWARGVVTTYHTNALGETFATTYSDGTPAVTNSLDRLGRATNIVDGSGNRNLVYDSNNQLLSETNTSGALIGMNLRYTNDLYQRRTSLSLYGTNTALLNHAYAFDGASRMTNISDGMYQAGYSYLANSPLISQIIYRSNNTTRMTTTKTYDFLNRLGSIVSQTSAAGAAPISYSYAYNDANQRVLVNIDDGSFWLYEYDSLGQLVSGKHYWSDWTPVAGQHYDYAFDDIGSR